MSAVTAPVPVPAPQPGRPAPVPWRNLVWVTFRQHRTVLIGVAALLGGISAWLLINGLLVRAAIHNLGLGGCHVSSTPGCDARLAVFQGEGYTGAENSFTSMLAALPGLIGIFAGAPLLARELETGTFRFAWTQGCGRARWITGKLVLLAVAVTASAAAVSLLIFWYLQPFLRLRLIRNFQPTIFDLRGADFAAWTLAAFTIAVIAGMLTRRTVAAIAGAAAGWAGLLLVVTMYLRRHYQAPLITRAGRAQAGQWDLSHWITGPGGHKLGTAASGALMQRFQQANGADFKAVTAMHWLAQHGYAYWMSYQPGSRFWPFQFAESGGLLVLSLLLGAATIWLVGRRAA